MNRTAFSLPEHSEYRTSGGLVISRVVEQFMSCRHELYPICQRGLGDSVFAAVERPLTLSGDDSSQRRNLSGRPLASDEARRIDQGETPSS